jgi:hypothetical protein
VVAESGCRRSAAGAVVKCLAQRIEPPGGNGHILVYDHQISGNSGGHGVHRPRAILLGNRPYRAVL